MELGNAGRSVKGARQTDAAPVLQASYATDFARTGFMNPAPRRLWPRHNDIFERRARRLPQMVRRAAKAQRRLRLVNADRVPAFEFS